LDTKRTVIVTGGGRGIGRDISSAFYHAGYHVLIASRQDSGLASQLGDRAKFVKTDVRQVEELKNLVDQTLNWTQTLNVLVNNAGLSGWRPLQKVDEPFWDLLIETNLKSALFATQAVVPKMKPGGVIINISSIAAKRGTANNSVYCAAKFGVSGITQALAKELGPQGIRVLAVCPVLIKTPGLLEALEGEFAPAFARGADAFLRQFAAEQSALQRLPSAQEVGEVCVFLASERASAMTGQAINVDCGVFPSL